MTHKISLIVIVTMLISFQLKARNQEQKPNVIIIVTDDQGYGDMSCHRNPFITTPALDQLHDDGVRLNDFHVDPTCAPTRAALMTGRYSARSGVWLTYGSRHHLRKNEVTIADVFQQNGYRTGMFGKWHLGDNYPFRPCDRGFDEALIHGGGVIGESPDYWDNNYYDDYYFRNNIPDKVEGYCTDVWFNEAIKFIDKNKEKPFFTYIATNAPHKPLHVPEKYFSKYLGKEGISKQRAYFYGMIDNIDENVGKLRQHLKAQNIDRKTIIIFFNDNGSNTGVELTKEDGTPKNGWTIEGYNAGMRGRKGSRFEGGHRAACFIYYPDANIIGGRDINGLSAQYDVLPTLIDLCDLNYQPKLPLDGTSIKKALTNAEPQIPNRTLFVHDQSRFGEKVGAGYLTKYKNYAVMSEKWRYVNGELYDLNTDFAQKNNIAAQHPEVVETLKKEYETWWNSIVEGSEEVNPYIINPEKQRIVKISSQNLLGDQVAYSQRMIRMGMKSNGFTYIDVEKPGRYKICLSRWPKESGLAMDEKAPPFPRDPSTHFMGKIKDVAFKVKTARLQVGAFDKTLKVKADDKQVEFDVDLKEGYQKIQTWLRLDNGEEIAAYYAYVEPIK